MLKKIGGKLLPLAIILMGVLLYFLGGYLRPAPEEKKEKQWIKSVEVISLKKELFAPKVIGFGRVEPKVQWQAIAQVSGKVVMRNPDLEKGGILSAGTKLLKIDPLDYQLRVAQAESDIATMKAQLQETEVRQQNNEILLGIEQKSLELSQLEFTRKQALRQKGSLSQSEIEKEEKSVYMQKKSVQELLTQKKILPGEINLKKAQLATLDAVLDEAKRSLMNTDVILPMDARIAQINTELNQVVNLQQVMLVADGIDEMKVEAQVALHDLQLLFKNKNGYQGILAEIEINSGRYRLTWPATVVGLSDSIDSNQATAGVILELDLNTAQKTEAEKNLIAGISSLSKGMFVKVTLEGGAEKQWVIPERALYGNKIYLMDKSDQLHIEQVRLLYRHDDQVAIEGPLKEGDRLIVTPLLPAIEGMDLQVYQKESPIVTDKIEPQKEEQLK